MSEIQTQQLGNLGKDAYWGMVFMGPHPPAGPGFQSPSTPAYREPAHVLQAATESQRGRRLSRKTPQQTTDPLVQSEGSSLPLIICGRRNFCSTTQTHKPLRHKSQSPEAFPCCRFHVSVATRRALNSQSCRC